MAEPLEQFELVCIGRTCVDLYGEQIGAPLHSTQTFRKYVGGSASNVCIGAARLGVRTAMIARVGDEPFGHFVRSTFQRAGVDTRAVISDPQRLTAVITLAIRKCDDFPRIFFYENSADMALGVDDIDEALVKSSQVLLVTGTHFSQPHLDAASRTAIRAAKQAGRRVAFDIDYRPVLWGLTGHARGAAMFVRSDHVSEHLQSILPDCDLIVGTKEEICIAGGSEQLVPALQKIRSLTSGVIVCKHGAQGSVVYPGEIHDNPGQGVSAMPFSVEVLNSTGAGDAYMAGLLYGWIRGHSWTECCRFGNACGAIVVSRHGCSSAMPSSAELEHFLSNRQRPKRLWEDTKLERLHWRESRAPEQSELKVLAFDHRQHFEELAQQQGTDEEQIRSAKRLVANAWANAAVSLDGTGAIIDDQYGGDLLEQLTNERNWLARPIEASNVTPLQFVGGPNVGLTLNSWPQEHVVKCLVFFDFAMDPETRIVQERQLQALFAACQTTGRELLLEVLPSRSCPSGEFDVSDVVEHFYSIGILPDWWKIENPRRDMVWEKLAKFIGEHDPACRGVILLGKGEPLDEIRRSMAAARRHAICKGFAVGRSIFSEPVEQWMGGKCNDDECVRLIEERYRSIVQAWNDAKPSP